MPRGSTTERRSPCTSTRSIAADGGASGSHHTSQLTRVVPFVRGRPFFFARKRAQAKGNTTQQKEDGPMTTATMATGTTTTDGGERAEGGCEAAGGHHEGARGPDGRECGLPVAVCERGQAVDAQDAGEGRGGPGRGPRAGDRLPTGRRRDRREQLHPGARPRDGHDHAGPGRPRRGVLRIHVGGGPWPRQHGRQGPDPDRVGAQGPGQGSLPHSAPTARRAW